jgi:hypothetical protein
MLEDLLFACENGGKWRSLPEKYGKWRSIYTRFNRWAKNGAPAKVFAAMKEARLIEETLSSAAFAIIFHYHNPSAGGAVHKGMPHLFQQVERNRVCRLPAPGAVYQTDAVVMFTLIFHAQYYRIESTPQRQMGKISTLFCEFLNFFPTQSDNTAYRG